LNIREKLAVLIYNIPVYLGFSRTSKFQKIALCIGDKIVYSKILTRISNKALRQKEKRLGSNENKSSEM
jgi:hypothetical protein